MSEDRTMNTAELRQRIKAMSREELERFAASAQLALDETRHEYQRAESELVRLHGQFARATWDATNPDAERVYHFHMCIAYHKDDTPEPVRAPIPGGYTEYVPGTERRYFHSGTFSVRGTYSASDMYRDRFHKICEDLQLSAMERVSVTVLSWHLMRDEL